MDVNVVETKDYYQHISQEELCDCNYCKNYREQIRKKYPDVTEYLASFGVEVEKPYETSPLEPDENGMLEYCACQYVVFGDCELSFRHKVGSVQFRVPISYPSTGIHKPHFLLEMSPIFWN